MKSLKSHYQSLGDIVAERIARLEKLISDLRQFHDAQARSLASLNRAETSLQIEHHSSSSSATTTRDKTSLEAQLVHLKQVKLDLDQLHANLNQLSEQAQRYLYAPHADAKFTLKLKSDLNEMSDKLAQLRSVHSRKQYALEDALLKSTKVDHEIEELEQWMAYKEQEMLDDEGVIITEEQFDQRKLKYKQIKSEVERKEAAVKRVLDNGNEMLKSAQSQVCKRRMISNVFARGLYLSISDYFLKFYWCNFWSKITFMVLDPFIFFSKKFIFRKHH